MGNLIRLSFLDLSNNELEGEFPRSSNQFNESLIQANLRFPNLKLLDVSENKFSGQVPNLSSCLSLTDLILYNNMFSGTLTKNIGYRSNVEYLYLDSNRLEGQISEAHLLNLSKLRVLDLSFNSNLTMKISPLWNPPFQLRMLQLNQLEVVDISDAKIFDSIPDWFWDNNQLSSQLNMSHNQIHGNMFNGTLTESIGYLPTVEHLDLSSNHLEGLISEAHLLNLSKLQAFDLSFNSNLTIKKELEVVDISNAKISDSIPHWFWDNNQMILQLNMSNNQIHGVLPDLSSKIHLSTLDLSSSEFSGSLPLLPQGITDVYLSINKFSGTIANFCRNFYALDLSDNLFAIEISQDCFTHLMILTYLNLANNNFSGEIQNSVDLGRLSSLHLQNNSFTGKFSRSLKNCSSLIILDLRENKFTGTIPTWLGESMLDLGVLSLKSNKLYGVLPSSLCYLASKTSSVGHFWKQNYRDHTKMCEELYCSVCYKRQFMWKGTIAEHVNALKLLTIIDLLGNNLTGEIPAEVTSLVGLFALNLSRNNLVGTNPRDIGRLELLNFLVLSQNNLLGSIPPTISQMSHLGMRDLSFNNLFGRILWNTHLQTFDASTYMGNPELCGPPLVFKTCIEDEMPKKPKFTNNVGEVHEKQIHH
ncbi:Leucine-rich repeat protein [Handroanthus impetiginosus]|uniref:Leucine-rich repeat protein n=1 Tax=Handroanthus impetiginosus TaxID=429701 RepID=A0A2G9H0P3_9LAMI|nr:Leucine-rich repeat protein [Handroanthus impetiginosus]